MSGQDGKETEGRDLCITKYIPAESAVAVVLISQELVKLVIIQLPHRSFFSTKEKAHGRCLFLILYDILPPMSVAKTITRTLPDN